LSDFDDDWGQPGVDENVARLTEVAGPRKRLSYEYDFGDSWHHTIKVVSVSPIGDGPDAEIPVCTGGARACPPEDVGGVWGYARSLEAAADPEDDEHGSYMEWLGGGLRSRVLRHRGSERRLEAQVLGVRQETGRGAPNSAAAVEPGGVDQLDIPIRLTSAKELEREAFLRETQELRFASTEQLANVAQSLELLDPNRMRSPLRFP
jgi:hypothetical protein